MAYTTAGHDPTRKQRKQLNRIGEALGRRKQPELKPTARPATYWACGDCGIRYPTRLQMTRPERKADRCPDCASEDWQEYPNLLA